MLGKLKKTEFGQALFGGLARGLITLVCSTTHWRRESAPEADTLMTSNQPFLAISWHNRLMLAQVLWPKGKTLAMVLSSHGDSQILARAYRSIISRPIVGSSRKDARAAYRGMIQALKDGLPVAVTPDGPRGPRMRCQMGVIQAAARAGVPVLPMSWSVKRHTLARSWDRFIIAWPFNSGIVKIGAPIEVPADSDRGTLEEMRQLVEARLNALTAEADQAMGHLPIEPIDPGERPRK